MEGIFLMVDKQKRIRFGRVVKEKRKKLGMDQGQFGLEIWGSAGVSLTAAQTRISRIERGDYWPPREDIQKIIDHLNIWDDAFATPDDDQDRENWFRIDPAWADYIPNLANMLQMMSDFARKGDSDHFYQMLNLMNEIASKEAKKAQTGNP
jgi:transcriptional regulator with XRE-family HTH domain